jgi:serine/threonine protein kinase
VNNYPDFSAKGYQVIRELGQNRAVGRLTYLATNINTGAAVVIKQFQFAQVTSNWSEYKVFETEVQALKQIQHSQIPRYLDSFESPTGLYLVQEYKKAHSLAQYKYFNLQEIQQIAISVLEILFYLQQQTPPIIHRDIKPENILVDRTKKPIEVYLVDFGFAHLDGREVGASSVVKGTLGFMPPEQIFNRQLTEASDLYSLGVTLIALLTQTKSSEIGNLIDESFCFKLKSRLPHLNPKFVVWLEKMVNPKLKHRFLNAAQALQAIQTISVTDRNPNYLGTTHQLKGAIIVIIFLGFLGVNFPHFWQLIFRNPSLISNLNESDRPLVQIKEVPTPISNFKATSINETVVVPLASGPRAVTSSKAYSGLINIVVSGTGQAAGTQFSDAFYLLTNTISPPPANEFGLFINGQIASNLFSPHQQIPDFSPSRHTYSFQINAPGGRLTFGVGDTFTSDNTGSFTITISPAVRVQ